MYDSKPKRKLFANKREESAVYAALRFMGVTHAIVYFSGGGDSGSIDSVEFFDQHDHCITDARIKDVQVSFTEIKDHFDYSEHKWVTRKATYPTTLNRIMEHITYQLLDDTGLDWYNNDGGSGKLVLSFDQSPPKIELEVGINRIETDTHVFNYDNKTGELSGP